MKGTYLIPPLYMKSESCAQRQRKSGRQVKISISETMQNLGFCSFQRTEKVGSSSMVHAALEFYFDLYETRFFHSITFA